MRQWIARGTTCDGLECGFEPFRRLVLAETGLQAELGDITDPGVMVHRTVEIGRARGFDFLPGDVEAAMLAARREWNQRQIV